MDKNKKPNDEKKLSGEKKQIQIYKKGDHYHCTVCHSEVSEKENCPDCHAEIDWERANENQTIPFFPG